MIVDDDESLDDDDDLTLIFWVLAEALKVEEVN